MITKILLVDDDADDRFIFEEALKTLDLEIRFDYSSNGLKALEFINDPNQINPETIFMDLNMPIMSGKDCLLHLRANENIEDINIVIYSTSFDSKTIDFLFENGANYYIRKPGDFKALKEIIQKTIKLTTNNNQKSRTRDQFVINS